MQSDPPSCKFLSKWGRCQQRASSGGLCRFHHRARKDPEFRFDDYYHRKIILGETTSTWGFLSDTQAAALLGGVKRKQDGRRLDHWIVDDPVEGLGDLSGAQP